MTVSNTTFTVLDITPGQNGNLVAHFSGDSARINLDRSYEKMVTSRYGSDCFTCGKPVNLKAPTTVGARGWQESLAVKSFFTLPGQPLIENVRPFHAGCQYFGKYVLSWEKDGTVLSATVEYSRGNKSHQVEFYAGSYGEWCTGTVTLPVGQTPAESLSILASGDTADGVMELLGNFRGSLSSLSPSTEAVAHAYVHLEYYRDRIAALDSGEQSLVLYDLFRGFGVYEAAKLTAHEQGISVRTVHDRIYRRDKESHG